MVCGFHSQRAVIFVDGLGDSLESIAMAAGIWFAGLKKAAGASLEPTGIVIVKT